jgi:hypothetical protein
LFDVKDVSDWEVADVIEAVGTKPKIWLRDHGGDLWLFKSLRKRAPEPSGEDWAEKAVCEIATLLGVPRPTTELAHRNESRGVISRNFVRDGASLVHGNELLSAKDPEYPQGQRSNDTPGYTVAAAFNALEGIAAPGGIEGELTLTPEATACDWFAGYLVLDAWVNNTDRHHMNWGVVKPDGTLTPSFDHGSSLAFGETEDRRASLLADNAALTRWLEKGRTKPFEGMPSMVDVAADGLSMCPELYRNFWIDSIEHIDQVAIDNIIDDIPESGPVGPILSDTARTLCKEILRINRERVLSVVESD